MQVKLLEEVNQPVIYCPTNGVLVLDLLALILAQSEDEQELVKGHAIFENGQTHLMVLLDFMIAMVPLLMARPLLFRIYSTCSILMSPFSYLSCTLKAVSRFLRELGSSGWLSIDFSISGATMCGGLLVSSGRGCCWGIWVAKKVPSACAI